MKLKLKVLVAAVVLSAVFIGCSNGSDDGSGMNYSGVNAPALPENVGENPFKGKTVSNLSFKIVFDNVNDTFVYTNLKANLNFSDVGKYTYNSETKKLYMIYTKLNEFLPDGTKVEFSSGKDYLDKMIRLGYTGTQADYDFVNKLYNRMFECVSTYDYVISETSVKLKPSLFDGKSTASENLKYSELLFTSDDATYDGKGARFRIADGAGWNIKVKEIVSHSTIGSYFIVPNITADKITGEMSFRGESSYTKKADCEFSYEEPTLAGDIYTMKLTPVKLDRDLTPYFPLGTEVTLTWDTNDRGTLTGTISNN